MTFETTVHAHTTLRRSKMLALFLIAITLLFGFVLYPQVTLLVVVSAIGALLTTGWIIFSVRMLRFTEELSTSLADMPSWLALWAIVTTLTVGAYWLIVVLWPGIPFLTGLPFI